MVRLSCKYDRHNHSYYTDGHERDDVVPYRKEYIKLTRRLSLRQPLWVLVEKASLSEAETTALEGIRERGDKAFGAKTYKFETGWKEDLEFHVDFPEENRSVEDFDKLREGLERKGGQYSMRFNQAVATQCEFFHGPGVCMCWRKLNYIGQDERVYKASACEFKEWVI